MNDQSLTPFPELEIKLCYTILKKMKISHLLNLDKEDIVQEILMLILEDEDKWMKIRHRSTNTTLIYTSLRNKILDFLDKTMTASDIARHSYAEAGQELYNQIRNEDGNAFETYCSLPEAERDFVKDFYNPNETMKRTELKRKHRITESQAARASKKVLRSARLDLTYRTLISINEGFLDV